MSRSRDLDVIAPDDDIIINTQEEEAVLPDNTSETIETTTEISDNTLKNENLDQKVYDILGHTKSPLSSFLVKPKILKFSEQDETEQILLAVRSHWVTNFSWMTVSFIMILVPFLFKFFSFLDFLPNQYGFPLVFFWYLVTFIYSFENFLSWYFDLFIITNERVVDIDFNNLLNKHFAETDLSMIQDVSSSVRGVLGTFFNYGDVLIQTASEINQINFDRVANPEKILKLLKEVRDLQENQGGNND